MTDSFPRQAARTIGFTLGAPRSFRLSPDGQTVVFLRSKAGTEPVTCLWALDVATGTERLIADPAEIGAAGAQDDPVEKARRERVRERAAGIVAFGTSADCTLAAFALAGTVYVADLRPGGSGVRALATRTPAADPRPDPAGRVVAYVSDGALRVHDIATGGDRALADPDGADGISFGLAEFVAAEEMDRSRGYWWAPDGSAILTARVDETAVQFWHIADPANPDREPRAIRYPAAGTPNAVVSVYVAALSGGRTQARWDSAAFPYLVNAAWDGADGGQPLLVVASRDQRDMRILAVDAATGDTAVVRADSDPSWVDIVTGVPAATTDGRIIWTADSGGAKRLVAGTAAEHAAGSAADLTPASLNVRAVLGVDGDTVLFAACADDPASATLWTAGKDGIDQVSPAEGVYDGQLAGGTLLLVSRTLADPAVAVGVLRAGPDGTWQQVAAIASHAETPSLPVPKPLLTWSSGPSRCRTAVLLPSWHQPGSGKLPVLCDPYGGPHGKRVLAAAAAYLSPQWFAEQGFAVVIADGRGTPGRGPEWDRAVAGDLAGPVLDDQVEALQSAAEQYGDLDLSRVGIRGWSFGGYLAALAVLRRPDVFHAAVAGAPPTDWRLYDTCYTERYLGIPADSPETYARSSLLADAPKLTRPLLLIHGLADDNVAVAHTLRLSSALLAAGKPHSVLPLSGVTHMASQEEVAENLLLLQVDFLRTSLGIAAGLGTETA
ncbi:MAG TPA: prolyl oligopeptidase family serine peptidase [Streptosporangiaceae bacterium]|nr:prolyl oligopeptidase family serine peptidase [Streptosporangiaceae bacterium]